MYPGFRFQSADGGYGRNPDILIQYTWNDSHSLKKIRMFPPAGIERNIRIGNEAVWKMHKEYQTT